MRVKFILAFALIGFTSLISQVVLLRELLVVFYGNELSVGAILAAWLLWVAAGSWGLPRLVRKGKSGSVSCFALLQAVTLLILPLELVLVRNVRTLAGAVPGQVIGFFPMLLWSLLMLAPVCLLLGWQFTAACQVTLSGWGIGRVYLCESLGAVGGGLLANYFLLYHLNAWQMALGLGFLNVFSALVQVRKKYLALALLVSAVPGLPVAAGFLEDLTLHQRWRGYDLVESRDSIYGNLAVTVQVSQYSFFENGLLLATTGDFLTAEETAHYSLLEHSQPRRVLLIGGGINGTVREILKHPVEQVDYVELDPTVVAVAGRYLPAPDRQALDDPRVTIHHLDGRLFVHRQNVRGASYDVVILSVPHPFTAQVNRLYSLEFFHEVRRQIGADGLFSLTLISAENYASRETQALNASVYRTLRQVFADVLVLPGDAALLLAAPRSGLLSADAAVLLERWNQRRVETVVLTPSHVNMRMAPERIDYGRRVFDQAAPLNQDLRPIGLYLDLVLWSSYFSGWLRDVMNTALAAPSVWLVIAGLVGVGLGGVIHLRSRPRPLRVVPWSLMVLGFAGMVWEVTLVFAFQVLYGYVYHQIALMMTAFMAGLALGSGWATRVSEAHSPNTIWRWLLAVHGGAVLYSLLLLSLLPFLRGLAAGQGVLPLLVGSGGLLVGAAFPLAGAIISEQAGEVGKIAGLLYAADLVGAALGAALAGALLIPVLGVGPAVAIVAAVNLGGWVLLTCAFTRSTISPR